jgi:hypothetical protein
MLLVTTCKHSGRSRISGVGPLLVGRAIQSDPHVEGVSLMATNGEEGPETMVL